MACALGLGVLAQSGCLPAPPGWQGPDSGHTVGVVGDSLTFQAQKGPDPLAQDNVNQFTTDALVARGYRGSVSAITGATTRSLDSVTGWPEPGLDIAVVALGTNDMRITPETGQTALSVTEATAYLDAYLARVAADCIVLVNVVETSTTWGLDLSAPAWNAVLAREVAVHHGVLVDWATAVRNSDVPLLGPDGVHHSEAGRTAYREASLAGVDACAATLDQPAG